MSTNLKTPHVPDQLSYIEGLMWKQDQDPRTRWSGAVVMLLDRAPDWDALWASFDRATREFPRLRQRIVTPPLNAGRPQWAFDEHFELADHVRREPLAPPHDLPALLDTVALGMMRGCDRARSPWRAAVVEPVGDGAALVIHINHAVIDGTGVMRLFALLLDAVREPGEKGPLPAAPTGPRVSELDLLRGAVDPLRIAGDVARQAGRSLASAGRSILRPVQLVEDAAGAARAVAAARSQPVHRSPIMQARSGRSVLRLLDLSLADIKAAGRAADATINDVYFAGMAGGLRRYHEEQGAPIDELSAGFAINVRTDADSVGGNHFTSATVSLPLGVTDPVERLRAAHARAGAAKVSQSALTAVLPVAYFAPSWVLSPLMEAGLGIEFGCSNVAGMSRRPFIGGAEVTRLYGFAPHPSTAMMVSLVSHADMCCLAYHLDPAAIPDADAFLRCQREGFDELLALT